MKVKIEKGVLQFEVADLVESLDDEAKANIGRYLVANTMLFGAVLECVTKDGHYFEDDTEGPWWFDGRSVNELREKLMPMMPEIARQAVAEALQQRNNAQHSETRTMHWASAMRRGWPDRGPLPPSLPPWDLVPRVKEEDIDKLMAGPKSACCLVAEPEFSPDHDDFFCNTCHTSMGPAYRTAGKSAMKAREDAQAALLREAKEKLEHESLRETIYAAIKHAQFDKPVDISLEGLKVVFNEARCWQQWQSVAKNVETTLRPGPKRTTK